MNREWFKENRYWINYFNIKLSNKHSWTTLAICLDIETNRYDIDNIGPPGSLIHIYSVTSNNQRHLKGLKQSENHLFQIIKTVGNPIRGDYWDYLLITKVRILSGKLQYIWGSSDNSSSISSEINNWKSST